MGCVDERMVTRAFRGWSFLLSLYMAEGGKILGIADDTRFDVAVGLVGNL